MKILYQGSEGAYSQLAAQEAYPKTDTISCKTFEECFQKCTEDENLITIIPVENSIAGRVADIQYLMNKYKLQIYAEHFHKVSHNLMALPGIKIKNIKSVRSHSQAISQCQKVIKENNLEPIIAADTAGSAKFISINTKKDEAAIASTLAAKIYNLEIIKKNIEDDKKNVTRFLIMGKNIEQPEYDKNRKYITSCIFRVKSEPSALYKCLGGFATNQVNLTKLESFSVKNTFDQANFYLDLEGHLEQFGVKKALEELGFHTETLDILGVYESSEFRQK